MQTNNTVSSHTGNIFRLEFLGTLRREKGSMRMKMRSLRVLVSAPKGRDIKAESLTPVQVSDGHEHASSRPRLIALPLSAFPVSFISASFFPDKITPASFSAPASTERIRLFFLNAVINTAVAHAQIWLVRRCRFIFCNSLGAHGSPPL